MNEFFIPNILLEPNVIHLELNANSIVVRIEMFSGVLTERTFTGDNCYLQLLAFLKQIEGRDNLQAKLVVN
jgi:hypothetical protein